jgi:beta-lactamase class A
MKSFLIISMIFFQVAAAFPKTNTDNLQLNIENYIRTKKANIGVAIKGIETGESILVGNAAHYPMQSVFKFHLVLAVLHQVDIGYLSLDQKILIKKSDVMLKTWSPLRKKYPEGNIELTLGEIIQYTVLQSDNNCCDILFRLVGGTGKVNEYIHNTGIQDVSIKATESEMGKAWDVQYTNWSSPEAAVDLLVKFYNGKLLSVKSYNFLLNLMIDTATGEKRIKGSLPVGTVVAHKTGTSGINGNGMTAATNDIGVITLPNGNHFAIAVFVSDSYEKNEVNEKIIAEISGMAWDCFTKE